MVDFTYLCCIAARFSMHHVANLPPSIAARDCPGMHHSATVKSNRQDAGKTSKSSPAHLQVQAGTGGSSAGEQRPGRQQALDSSNHVQVRQQSPGAVDSLHHASFMATIVARSISETAGLPNDAP